MNTIPNFSYDVGVIGLGRVGLPLALSFVEQGLRVLGFEKSEHQLEAIRMGHMPFFEPGYEVLAGSGKLEVTTKHERVAEVKRIIITVGTPLRHHVETDLSQVMQLLESLLPYLCEGQTLILRSTVAPYTTEYVRRVLSMRTSFTIGENFFLAFCPERLAAGRAKEELATLPQVVGTEDAQSAKEAAELFAQLGPNILHTNFISAELLKLFCNIYRYVNFAIANNFALIADHYGANVYEIIRLANENYPRSQIPLPGFAAGACLRKDFGMISEDNPYADLFLNAWRVNEYTPRFLVLQLKKRMELFDKRIVVLGATFKSNSDDLRDSLTPKLVRYLEREVPRSIAIHEPFLGDSIVDEREGFSYPNVKLEDVLPQADVIFIAMNHELFVKDFSSIFQMAKIGTWVVDIWNVSHRDQIFFKK